MLEDPGRPQFNEDRPVLRLTRGSRQPEVTIATCRPRPGSKTAGPLAARPSDFDVGGILSPCRGVVPYKYFTVPTNFAEDRWVQSVEIRPAHVRPCIIIEARPALTNLAVLARVGLWESIACGVLICYIISKSSIHMSSHIKGPRLNRLPEAMRLELIEARHKRGWSQAELGQHLGMPQMHVSGIETGKIVPRFDTLLDLVRVLDRDLLMVPRALVPAIQALIRDHRHPASNIDDDAGERPLYAVDRSDEA